MRLFTILILSSVAGHPPAALPNRLLAPAVVSRDTTAVADTTLPLLTEPLVTRYVALRHRLLGDSIAMQAIGRMTSRPTPVQVGTIPGIPEAGVRAALSNVEISIQDPGDLAPQNPAVATYFTQAKFAPQEYYAVHKAIIFALMTDRARTDLAKGAAPARALTVMDQNVVFIQAHPELVGQSMGMGDIQGLREWVDQMAAAYRPNSDSSKDLVP